MLTVYIPAIAQASLTETLFKLNTGLVGIISSFLCNGRNELQLDYKSLTNLSDASRSDAIETLSQLYERLSQSSLALNSVKACCSHCETGRYATLAVPKGVNNALPCRHPHRSRRKKKQAVNRANFSSPTVARVPLKSSSQTQMVIVRPRNRRTASSSSNSSSNSHSTDHTTAMTALSSSTTLPRASSFPTQTAASRLVTQKSKPRSNQRTRTWPQVQNANQETSISATLNSSLNTPMSATSARASSLAPVPRRLDKTTPSAYSWASDSTKLGEIPMRKWTFPSDYESMETINAEAAASGAIECRGKSKWKLFGFLRRGGEMV